MFIYSSSGNPIEDPLSPPSEAPEAPPLNPDPPPPWAPFPLWASCGRGCCPSGYESEKNASKKNMWAGSQSRGTESTRVSGPAWGSRRRRADFAGLFSSSLVSFLSALFTFSSKPSLSSLDTCVFPLVYSIIFSFIPFLNEFPDVSPSTHRFHTALTSFICSFFDLTTVMPCFFPHSLISSV